MEKFRVEVSEDVTVSSVGARPGNVLVGVRNPNRLDHLQQVLDKTDTNKVDIVALSVRPSSAAGSGEHDLEPGQIFSQDETRLFSKVVTWEKAGRPVKLLPCPERTRTWPRYNSPRV
jgi:hypothetical protein